MRKFKARHDPTPSQTDITRAIIATPLPIIIGVSLVIAAVAWIIPFMTPMACSYWASGIWRAIVIMALAFHGKRGLWVFLGTPLALWHAAFAALIYIAWR